MENSKILFCVLQSSNGRVLFKGESLTLALRISSLYDHVGWPTTLGFISAEVAI